MCLDRSQGITASARANAGVVPNTKICSWPLSSSLIGHSSSYRPGVYRMERLWQLIQGQVVLSRALSSAMCSKQVVLISSRGARPANRGCGARKGFARCTDERAAGIGGKCMDPHRIGGGHSGMARASTRARARVFHGKFHLPLPSSPRGESGDRPGEGRAGGGPTARTLWGAQSRDSSGEELSGSAWSGWKLSIASRGRRHCQSKEGDR